MSTPLWTQFSWDLAHLPPGEAPLPAAYRPETSVSSQALPSVEDVLTRSYLLEQEWGPDLHSRLDIIRRLLQASPQNGIEFLGIKHGSRFVGAVGVDPQPEAPDHFPTGICVLSEYRCRGIGSHLLYLALGHLKEKGLQTVRSVAKKRIPAERFLYRKFGSARADLDAPPVIAANGKKP